MHFIKGQWKLYVNIHSSNLGRLVPSRELGLRYLILAESGPKVSGYRNL